MLELREDFGDDDEGKHESESNHLRDKCVSELYCQTIYSFYLNLICDFGLLSEKYDNK